MFDSNALKIYTDGSTFKNPGGKGGYAGIVEYPEPLNRANEVIFCQGLESTTNQRAELLACINAIEYTGKNITGSDISRVIIVTDSSYVYEYQNLAYTWRKNNWKNEHGRPIKNKDLWQKFISLKTKVPIEIKWQKGKSTEILKEVDRLAKKATKGILKKDYGYQPGKVGKSKLQTNKVAELFPADSQFQIIRVYEKNLASKNDSTIKFELMTEDGNDVIGKYIAYTSPKIAASTHRHHCYTVRFNNNKKYPKIEGAVEFVPKE